MKKLTEIQREVNMAEEVMILMVVITSQSKYIKEREKIIDNKELSILKVTKIGLIQKIKREFHVPF